MRAGGQHPGGAGLYLHLPFCSSKCHYCDFYSYIASSAEKPEELQAAYARHLIEHLNRFGSGMPGPVNSGHVDHDTKSGGPGLNHDHGSAINTLFVGGGTPSLFDTALFGSILDAVEENVTGKQISDLVESTIEVNPEHFDLEKGRFYTTRGINRISMGIQTLSAEGLAMLGRQAGADRSARALEDLAALDCRSRSVDLIYGWPGQTAESFNTDLEQVMAAGVEHISLYSLTVEKGTTYASRIRRGEAAPPDDSLAVEIMDLLDDEMAGRGYVRYEVSNFARPGHFCRHNLHYWSLAPYLAFGVSAHGLWNGWRTRCEASLPAWLKQQAAFKDAEEQAASDVVLTLLRLFVPVPVSELMVHLSERQAEGAAALLQRWYNDGVIELAPLAQFDSLMQQACREVFNYIALDDAAPAFAWLRQGRNFLNDYQLEMYELLS